MTQHFLCWDGPCEGTLVTDVPMTAAVGHACALPWSGPRGKRYAVYILLQKDDGAIGLVHDRSYDQPFKAQQRVHLITAAVEAAHAELN